jgi:hypothetical protein
VFLHFLTHFVTQFLRQTKLNVNALVCCRKVSLKQKRLEFDEEPHRLKQKTQILILFEIKIEINRNYF